MKPRILILALLALALLYSLASAAPSQPHIVFILADDLGWNQIGKRAGVSNLHNDHASEYYLTPQINRLAEMGMTFNRAYAAPNCAPTRAALMTGVTASRHGITSVFDRGGLGTADVKLPNNAVELAASFQTLAETLKAAGYATGHFGKWHIGLYTGANALQNQGFDINVGGAGNEHSSPETVGNGGTEYHADTNGQWLNQGSYLLPKVENGITTTWTRSQGEHLSDALTDEAHTWMDAQVTANPDTPVFLYLPHHATHSPIDSKASDTAAIPGTSTDPRHDRQAFGGLLYGMDRSVGDLLDYLENNNDDQGNPLIDNTVFIFMADNGGEDISLDGRMSPLRGAKGSQFEGGVRVPLFISTPAMRTAGQANTATDQAVHVQDFHATLAALAGTTAPAGLDGVDFSQVLTDPGNTFSRDIFEWWLQQPNSQDGEATATLHRGNLKLIWYPFEAFNSDLTARFDLFDVVNDLSETTDLSDDPAYAATLLQMANDIGDKLEADGAALPYDANTLVEVPLPNTFYAYGESAKVGHSSAVLIDVLANDWDPNNEIDPTTVQVVGAATEGSTSVNPTTGVITYTHSGNNLNADSFTYTFDSTGVETSNEATVSISVQVGWDGNGGTDNDLGVTANWSPDTAPTSTTGFLVDNNTGFSGTGEWILSLASQPEYGSIEFTAAGTGANAGRLAIRAGAAFGRFKMYGDLIFSGNAIDQDITLQGTTTRNLAWAGMTGGTHSIINNTSATVSFGASNGFNFSAWNGSSAILQFGGTGDFVIGPTVDFDNTPSVNPSRLNRLYTAPDFSGTVTIQDGNTVYLDNDIRTQSGTIKIEGTDTVDDGVALAYNSDNGGVSELDISGLSDTVGFLASYSGVGTHRLTVDGNTDLIATDLRSTGGVAIDIQGWAETQSSLVFTDLGGNFYGGTVAEDAVIDFLTIEGQPAYLTQVADVNGDTVADWAVTTNAPPITVNSANTLQFQGNDLIDDRTDILLNGGTLDPNGYSDSIDSLTMLIDSTINLNSGGSIAFADSSAIDWGHAVLFINGTLGANSVRFGTNDTALTMEQQSLIRVNGQKARLDANGYLKTITERTESGFQVIGFSRISDQFNTPVVDDMSYYAPLTELIFIPVTPIPATGAIDTSAFTPEIREHLMAAKKAQEGMRVRLSVAGKWDTGEFNFVIDPSLRATFVQNLLELVLSTGMDGADYDWEYPSYQTEQYLAAYDDLITDTKTAFAPYGLDVTLDTNSWAGDVGAASVNDAYAAADRVYDMTYFDFNDTRTSLIRYEEQRGLNRSKVAFGVPFYARLYSNKQIGGRKYRDIVDADPGDLVANPVEAWNNFYAETASPTDIFFFNNLDLIQLQTRMLMDSGAGGIMIWDLLSDYWEGTHPDYPGVPNLSLLNAIGEAVDTWTPSNEVSYNGGFDVMLEGWETLVEGSSSADLTVAHDTSSALNGAFSARVDVTTAGSAAEDARFSQVFEVEADKAYKVTFTAKSGGASLNVPVSLLRYASYFTQYGAGLQAETYSVTSTASTHSFFFETDTTEFLRLTFDLGLLPPGTTLYLDDILVEEVPYITTTSELSGSQPDTVISLVGGTTLSGSGTARKVSSLPLGTVAPGTSGTPIGTISLLEDIQMPLASTFKVDANRASGAFTNDQLTSGGSVEFYGTIDLLLDGEPLQAGDEITVLTGNIAMPTYRDVPARVVVDPASPTPLPDGLELKVVYYSDKITVLAQAAPAANVLRNPDFDQGMFFWDTIGPRNGVISSFSADPADPQAGKNSLKIDISSAGTNSWADLQVLQNLLARAGDTYTVSFKVKASAPTSMSWSVGNTKLARDFTNPNINGFSNFGVNIGTSWQTISQSFTPAETDSAVLSMLFGQTDAGAVYIDDVKVTTTGTYPPVANDFTVLGYIPAYRFGASDLIKTNPEFFKNIDVLIYGFIMTDANGALLQYYQQSAPGSTQWNYTQDIEDTLQTIKTDYDLELLVAIGGGGVDETVFFNDVLPDSGKRTTLINNLIAFCNAEGFDGVDLDYEYAAAGTNQQENYELFVEEAKTAFTGAKTGGGDLVLTAAVDTFSNAYYPPDAYTAHRSNHMMNYAKDYDAHVLNIFELFNAGAPMASIYPGIEWSADDGSTSTAWNNIVDQFNPARYDNTAGEWTFNGIDAVRQKIQLARALGCGGIMIWELGHDKEDAPQSLIINALEDADDDALLDEWEDDFSGGLNLRPFDDDDGDGLGNLWENLTNTDPLDGGSQAAPVSAVPGGQFQVSFPYVNTNRFDLFAEWNDDLTDPAGWTPVEDGVNATVTQDTENGTYTIELSDPIGAQPSFIRVGTQISQ